MDRLLESQKELDEHRELALKRVVRAHKKFRETEREYEEAVLTASALNVSHTKIARAIGVSETAVRSYVKRRKND